MADVMVFFYTGHPGNQLFGKKYFRVKINIARIGEVDSPYMFTYNEVAEWARQCKHMNDNDRKNTLSRALAHFGASTKQSA